MGAVVAVNLPPSGLEAGRPSEAGYVSVSQTAKDGDRQQTAEKGTLFTKFLAQKLERMKKESGTDSDQTDGMAEEDGAVCDAAVISGLMAQLFAMQPSGLENLPTEECLGDLTIISAAVHLTGEGSVVFQPEGELSETVVAGVHGAKDEPEGQTAPEGAESADAVSGLLQAGEQTVSISAASVGRQDGKSDAIRPAADGDGGQEKEAISQKEITENIVKALKSSGGENEETEQSFQELLSGEKTPPSEKKTEKTPADVGLFPESKFTGDVGNTEKVQAVEKAIDRFLSDFKGAAADNSEIQIVLEPKSLGTLTIAVSRTDSGVTAKIRSDDREICAAISDQLQKLISSMESKGISVQDVDVVFSGANQNPAFSQNNPSGGYYYQPQGETAQTGKGTEISGGTGLLDLPRDIPAGDGTSGLLEYRV